jgi:hypothetical protein
MSKHETLAAALIVFMGAGLVGGTVQDEQPAKAADPAVEFEGLKVSGSVPQPKAKDPLEAVITVENPCGETREVKIPVKILKQESSPDSRRMPAPQVLRTEEIQVKVEPGKKTTAKIRIEESWTPKEGMVLRYSIDLVTAKEPVHLAVFTPAE